MKNITFMHISEFCLNSNCIRRFRKNINKKKKTKKTKKKTTTLSIIYEGGSISNQPNLFPVEIHLFCFDVIALLCDALRPTVFKCHQPRTEKVRVLSIDPLLNCLHDFFIRPEMKSTDILFQGWE